MARRPAGLAADGDAIEERGAQAIHRALNVLEVFSMNRPSVSLTEISEAAGLTLPTAHRMVRALKSRGYLVHDALTGQYSLGSSVIKLSQVLLYRAEQDQLLALAGPHLEALRHLTNETVSMNIAVGAERVCIAEFASFQVVRMATGVGRVFPIHSGAAGKALLSGMSDAKLDALFPAAAELVMPATAVIITPSRLRRDLISVREDGYAMSFGETVVGASALAVPLFGAQGVIASINIAGPATRWTRVAMESAIAPLLATATTISEHLGWRPAGTTIGRTQPNGTKRAEKVRIS